MEAIVFDPYHVEIYDRNRHKVWMAEWVDGVWISKSLPRGRQREHTTFDDVWASIKSTAVRLALGPELHKIAGAENVAREWAEESAAEPIRSGEAAQPVQEDTMTTSPSTPTQIGATASTLNTAIEGGKDAFTAAGSLVLLQTIAAGATKFVRKRFPQYGEVLEHEAAQMALGVLGALFLHGVATHTSWLPAGVRDKARNAGAGAYNAGITWALMSYGTRAREFASEMVTMMWPDES